MAATAAPWDVLLAGEELAHTERSPHEARPSRCPTTSTTGSSEALRAGGVDALYTHQAEALAAARAGRHVLVATGTASGKTLAFNLPVLDTLAAEPKLRALYLYPTKALAQDQARSLAALPCRAYAPRSTTATPSRNAAGRSASGRTSSSRTPTC